MKYTCKRCNKKKEAKKSKPYQAGNNFKLMCSECFHAT